MDINTTTYKMNFQKAQFRLHQQQHCTTSWVVWISQETPQYFFSNGCGGKNKNTIIIVMLSYWLLKEAPNNIKEIKLCFLILGHSFIPPDRVFGNLERQFKKQTVIENPGKYLSIFGTYCTVIRLGLICPVLNWKLA